VEEADGGRAALELLEKSVEEGLRYDFILLDMHMPEMDGAQLARTIKADGRHSTPMVMLTSAADENRALLQDVGIRACLSKPIRQSSLLETLTAVVEGRAAVEGGSGAQAKSSRRPLTAGRAKLFAAEDNEANQEVLSGIADHLGYDITIVSNGRQAVEALEKDHPYAVALMDCQMPELDGYEATRMIRAAEARRSARRVPIIAVTAHALAGEREKVLDFGMDDYMVKPIEIEILRRKLELWVGSRPSPSEDGTPSERAEPTERLGEEPLVDERIVGQLRTLVSPKRPRFLRDLLDKYTRDARRYLADIETAIDAGDSSTLREKAHALKSSSRTLGVVQVSSLCEELECIGKSSAVEGARPLFAHLSAAFERSLPAVERAIGS
jgi:CheY-like chemotaxis protein